MVLLAPNVTDGDARSRFEPSDVLFRQVMGWHCTPTPNRTLRCSPNQTSSRPGSRSYKTSTSLQLHVPIPSLSRHHGLKHTWVSPAGRYHFDLIPYLCAAQVILPDTTTMTEEPGQLPPSRSPTARIFGAGKGLLAVPPPGNRDPPVYVPVLTTGPTQINNTNTPRKCMSTKPPLALLTCLTV